MRGRQAGGQRCGPAVIGSACSLAHILQENLRNQVKKLQEKLAKEQKKQNASDVECTQLTKQEVWTGEAFACLSCRSVAVGFSKLTPCRLPSLSLSLPSLSRDFARLRLKRGSAKLTWSVAALALLRSSLRTPGTSMRKL